MFTYSPVLRKFNDHVALGQAQEHLADMLDMMKIMGFFLYQEGHARAKSLT